MSDRDQERPNDHLDEGRLAHVQPPQDRDQPADPGDLQPAERGLRDVPVLRVQRGSGSPGILGAQARRYVIGYSSLI